MEGSFNYNSLRWKIILSITLFLMLLFSCSERIQLEKLNTQIPDLIQQKKYHEAEAAAKKSLDLAVSKFGENHHRVAISLKKLAFNYKNPVHFGTCVKIMVDADEWNSFHSHI